MIISKSKYLSGLQCPKLLWYLLRAPEDVPELDEASQEGLRQGVLVGELAQKLFPQGVLVDYEKGFDDTLTQTKVLVAQKKVVFEASFLSNNCYCRCDILVPTSNGWNIIEVKASSRVKDVHIQDLSFQKHILQESGLKINNSYIMHINKDYLREEDIDVTSLFVKEEVNDLVDSELTQVPYNLKKMFDVLEQDMPQTPIGTQCNNPYECIMKSTCWSYLPENNVTQLYYNNGFDFINQGVLGLVDIPSSALSEKQQIQQEATKKQQAIINKKKIHGWLSKLEYPLFFFDFETTSSAIPFFNKSKPYQQIPFQYSLHIIREPGAEPEHYEFLWEELSDPREELVKTLSLFGTSGSVLAYSMSFERKVLVELKQIFPEHKKTIDNIISRLVDLIVPFRKFWYYHPKQQGKTSIKYILPAIHGFGYESLTINQGDLAAREWFRAASGSEDKEQVFSNLREYCCLDTKAMIILLKELERVSI